MENAPKPKVTPKDFFLWFGSMVVLYTLIVSFLNLLFAYVDFAFRDPLLYTPDPYSGIIRWDMAAILVLFPLYLYVNHLIRKDALLAPEKKELWVRRWVIVLTIFLAGAVAAVDLIILVSDFLGGSLTTPFLLKVLVVLLTAAAVFFHHLAYLKGYWESHQREVHRLAAAVGIMLIATLAAGFVIMGSPWEVRLYRFDEQKVSDLQNIQWQVVDYWQQQGTLPKSLADLSDSISGYQPPTDPQSGAAYGYKVLAVHSFELCATFNRDGDMQSAYGGAVPMAATPVAPGGNLMSSDWYHGAGDICFERTIDPTRYPVTKK
ncbi:MAG: hypothetical protein KGI73_04115 [Patescibacteria group bacterium]|nr:hypothetical protein [Patescibacteria group bacterium]